MSQTASSTAYYGIGDLLPDMISGNSDMLKTKMITITTQENWPFRICLLKLQQ